MNTAQHGYGGVWTAVVPSGGSVTVTMGSALAVSTAEPARPRRARPLPPRRPGRDHRTARPGSNGISCGHHAGGDRHRDGAVHRGGLQRLHHAGRAGCHHRQHGNPAARYYGGRFCYRHPATRCRQHQHPRPRGPAGPGTRPGRTRRRGLVPGPCRFGLGHRHHGLGAGRHDGAAGSGGPAGPDRHHGGRAGRRHDPACPGRLGRIRRHEGSALAVTTARPAVTASGSAGVSPGTVAVAMAQPAPVVSGGTITAPAALAVTTAQPAPVVPGPLPRPCWS